LHQHFRHILRQQRRIGGEMRHIFYRIEKLSPGANTSRTAIDFYRALARESVAVKAKHHDLLFDHALNENRSVVAAPCGSLAPVSDSRFGHGRKGLVAEPKDFQQAGIVEERRRFRVIRSVHHSYRDVTAIC
jgi:hypothetical protein